LKLLITLFKTTYSSERVNCAELFGIPSSREALLKGKTLSTLELFVVTSSVHLLFILKLLFTLLKTSCHSEYSLFQGILTEGEDNQYT
jgi:hypothetical protein